MAMVDKDQENWWEKNPMGRPIPYAGELQIVDGYCFCRQFKESVM